MQGCYEAKCINAYKVLSIYLAHSKYLIKCGTVIIFNNKLFPLLAQIVLGFMAVQFYCGLQLQKRNELDLEEGSEQNL